MSHLKAETAYNIYNALPPEEAQRFCVMAGFIKKPKEAKSKIKYTVTDALEYLNARKLFHK